MITRHRAQLAVLAFAVCAAVIAAGLTKAVLDARESLIEEIAGPESLEDGPEPSHMNWPPDPDLTRRVTQ